MTRNEEYFRWSYAAEKFGTAKDKLTRSFAPGHQRMIAAMHSIMRLHEADFPDRDLWERTKKLKFEATKFGPIEQNGEVIRGSLENTLCRRKRVTFERMAEEIIAIDFEIASRRGEYRD